MKHNNRIPVHLQQVCPHKMAVLKRTLLSHTLFRISIPLLFHSSYLIPNFKSLWRLKFGLKVPSAINLSPCLLCHYIEFCCITFQKKKRNSAAKSKMQKSKLSKKKSYFLIQPRQESRFFCSNCICSSKVLKSVTGISIRSPHQLSSSPWLQQSWKMQQELQFFLK